MYYTNMSGAVIIISRLRDKMGNSFRLKPGESVDLRSARWPVARVRACARLLSRYVATGELAISSQQPIPKKKKKTRKKREPVYEAPAVEIVAETSPEEDEEGLKEPEKTEE